MTRTQLSSPSVDEIEGFFAALDPASMKDASRLREIASARRAIEESEQRLREAVAAARAAGDSWSAIGLALRTSKQNAYRKFGDSRRAKPNPSSGE